jgi:hypothetical protein
MKKRGHLKGEREGGEREGEERDGEKRVEGDTQKRKRVTMLRLYLLSLYAREGEREIDRERDGKRRKEKESSSPFPSFFFSSPDTQP